MPPLHTPRPPPHRCGAEEQWERLFGRIFLSTAGKGPRGAFSTQNVAKGCEASWCASCPLLAVPGGRLPTL